MRVVTHNVYDLPTGLLHSISIEDKGDKIEGTKVGYGEIARLAAYAATTEAYQGVLPSLFIIDTDGFHKEHLTFNKVPDKRFPHLTKEG